MKNSYVLFLGSLLLSASCAWSQVTAPMTEINDTLNALKSTNPNCPEPNKWKAECTLNVAELTHFKKSFATAEEAQKYLDAESARRFGANKNPDVSYGGWVIPGGDQKTFIADVRENKKFETQFSLDETKINYHDDFLSYLPGHPKIQFRVTVNRSVSPSVIKSELWDGKEWVGKPAGLDESITPYWHAEAYVEKTSGDYELNSFLRCKETESKIKRYELPWDEVWNRDYDAVKEQSKFVHKPILIFFTGEGWCVPCKMARETILETQAFLDAVSGKVILAEVNIPKTAFAVGKALPLMKQFKIEHVPSFILVKPDGSFQDLVTDYNLLDFEHLVASIKAAK